MKKIFSRCDKNSLYKARQICLKNGITINQYLYVLYTMIARKGSIPSFYKKEQVPTDYDVLWLSLPDDVRSAAQVVLNEHQTSNASFIRSAIYFIALNQEFPIDMLELKKNKGNTPLSLH